MQFKRLAVSKSSRGYLERKHQVLVGLLWKISGQMSGEVSASSFFQRFWAGNFIARKTKWTLSIITFNQAHEQCSALVKGGAVSLTNDSSALSHWIVAGLEM
ncbi:hypothetical protein PoB_003978200 [Plakobranchus ocellatus]|uniref:Uncharacterized protein n=1 Tax=Plakobranchus ocellatus TaxID=259542 RepID=A0AAV4B2F1_9GAST|nr:hypothetical protein PoB_003978200 [Plakobranchus ocellatus]